MFKFESFFKKGQEDVKKAAKIGTLAVGIGAGIASGSEKVQAQDTAYTNQVNITTKNNKIERPEDNQRNYDFQDYFNKEKHKYNPAKFNDLKIATLAAKIAGTKDYLDDYLAHEDFSTPDSIREGRIKRVKSYQEKLDAELEKILSERESDIKSYEEAKAEYDKILEKLINHVASPEYLEKLSREYECSIEEAKKIQKARLEAVKAGDYSLIEGLSSFTWQWDEVDGNIKNNSGKVYLQYNAKNKEEIITHEVLGHKATFAELGLSEKARQIFKEAYRHNPEFLLDYAKEEKFNINTPEETEETFKELTEYFSDISEIYARKKNLEMEMETLGIKKYGEKFTPKHLKILGDLKKQNKLSASAKQFLEIIKPEYLEVIFNDIAENNINLKDNSYKENEA